MMTHDNICFIGDSHLACIKLAINDDPAFAEVLHPAFFGASGHRMGGLQLAGTRLVATNMDLETRIKQVSGGASSIELDRYGCFVLVGLGCHSRTLLQLTRHYGTREHARWGNVRNLMSDASFEQTLRDIFENMICLRIARAIRSVSRAPIVLVSAPGPSEAILQERSWAPHQCRLDSPYFEVLDLVFRNSVSSAMTCEDTQLVFQPEETLMNRVFTALSFKRAGVGFNANKAEGYGDDEHWHMNKSYGAVMLRSLKSAIERRLALPLNAADAA